MKRHYFEKDLNDLRDKITEAGVLSRKYELAKANGLGTNKEFVVNLLQEMAAVKVKLCYIRDTLRYFQKIRFVNAEQSHVIDEKNDTVTKYIDLLDSYLSEGVKSC